jgi:hypothetical protein
MKNMKVRNIVVTKYERLALIFDEKLWSFSPLILIIPKQTAKTVKKVYGILYFGSVVMLQTI